MKFMAEIEIFCQKWKFRPKIEIRSKSKFWSKIEILDKKLNFRPKGQNFGQKIKIFRKLNISKICFLIEILATN